MLVRAGAVVALGLAAASCGGDGRSPAEFHGGRTLRIVVGFTPGGGYDLNARLVAQFIGRHLPGAPAVVVDNMPGAGGLIAANYLAHQAPRDGLTIGMLSPGAIVPQVLGRDGVQYDLRRFAVLGSPTLEPEHVCIASRNRGVTLDEWRAHAGGLRAATTGWDSLPHLMMALMAGATGLPVRYVVGYRGTADIRLALDAGEVDLYCIGLGAYRAAIAPQGRSVVVLQSGSDPELDRQGVPSAARLVSDPQGRELLAFLDAIRTLDRFYVAPPDTADDIVATLRAAFESTMIDRDFVAAAREAHVDLAPTGSAEVASRIEAVLSVPNGTRTLVDRLLAPGQAR